MKTAKEKAVDLVEKYKPHVHFYRHDNDAMYLSNAKQCALIAVDDEIKILSELKDKLKSLNLLDSTFEVIRLIDELQEVKEEINNIK